MGNLKLPDLKKLVRVYNFLERRTDSSVLSAVFHRYSSRKQEIVDKIFYEGNSTVSEIKIIYSSTNM